jgi:hypothetical protein
MRDWLSVGEHLAAVALIVLSGLVSVSAGLRARAQALRRLNAERVEIAARFQAIGRRVSATRDNQTQVNRAKGAEGKARE